MDNNNDQQSNQFMNQMQMNMMANQFASNFMSNMRNFTGTTFYGLTSKGSLFSLVPESFNMGGMADGICVSTLCRNDSSTFGYSQIGYRWYQRPIESYPLYIEDHNCVLFSTAEERAKAIEKYEDGSRLVKSYAAGTVPLINASYVAITCLNKDKQYFTVAGGQIKSLPNCKEEDVDIYLHKYGIQKEKLQIADIFIIDTIIRSNGISATSKDSIISTDIRIVEHSQIIKNEPIIFENNGLVILDGRDSAESFIRTYGTVANYMVKQALKVTHNIHESEIKDLNEQVAKDKRGMFETFMLMGGTSVASILTENVIKSYNSGDDSGETVKKALKIFGIGMGGLAICVGAYKGYRYLKEKKDKEKAKENQ